jgi:hypothetical protein
MTLQTDALIEPKPGGLCVLGGLSANRTLPPEFEPDIVLRNSKEMFLQGNHIVTSASNPEPAGWISN